jgi:FkbM family methyltransferase
MAPTKSVRRLIRIVTIRMFPFLYERIKQVDALINILLKTVHDSDLELIRELDSGSYLCCDIGANSGQTAISIHSLNKNANILSFEANPSLEENLASLKKVLKNFDYKIVALSDSPGNKVFYVPCFNGVYLSQASTLQKEFLEARLSKIAARVGGTPTIQEFKVSSCRFDDLKLEPYIVKIDVEGHELNVLKGMEDTLEKSKPYLLIEKSPKIKEVISFLESLGYETYQWDSKAKHLSVLILNSAIVKHNFWAVHRDHKPKVQHLI